MLEFNYVYKIIELTTGREYIGRHKTYDLNDNYMGSGTAITAAYERNPSNFVKTILWFCNSQNEAIELEGALVDKHYIQRNYPDKTFNINSGVMVDDYTKFRWIKKLYPNTELGFIIPTGTGKISKKFYPDYSNEEFGLSGKSKIIPGSIKNELKMTNSQRVTISNKLKADGRNWKSWNSDLNNIDEAKQFIESMRSYK